MRADNNNILRNINSGRCSTPGGLASPGGEVSLVNLDNRHGGLARPVAAVSVGESQSVGAVMEGGTRRLGISPPTITDPELSPRVPPAASCDRQREGIAIGGGVLEESAAEPGCKGAQIRVNLPGKGQIPLGALCACAMALVWA